MRSNPKMARVGGRLRSVNVANPAAGTEFALAPPAGKMWEVICLSFLFTSGVTAANRACGLSLQGPSLTVLGLWRAGIVQAASLVRDYSAPAHAAGDPQATTHCLIPMPKGIRIGSSAWRFGSSCHGLQATDQYSNIWALVEEWDI